MWKKYTTLHNMNNEIYKNNILIWNRNHNPHQIVQRSNTRKVIVKTQEIKAKKIYIGNLNENVTNEDIYKLFRLKTTEYLHQTNIVDLKRFKIAEKPRGFGFVTVPEFVST